jgi:hypothetical protein
MKYVNLVYFWNTHQNFLWCAPRISDDLGYAAPRPNQEGMAVNDLEKWRIPWKCKERRGNVRECEEMWRNDRKREGER